MGLEESQARDVLSKLDGLSFFEGVTTAIEIITSMNEQLMGECPICMESLGDGAKLFRMKSCFHAVHRDCVIQYWSSYKKQKDAEKHMVCPVCREKPDAHELLDLGLIDSISVYWDAK